MKSTVSMMATFLPASPERRPRVGHVVLELLHPEEGVLLPLDELVGTGAHGLRDGPALLLDLALRVDHDRADDVGEVGEEDARRGVEPDADRRGVGGLDVLDQRLELRRPAALVAHPVERVGDVLRVHHLAVVELDALPDRDRVGEAVGADRVLVGQHRLDRQVLAEGVEHLVHVQERDPADVVRRQVEVDVRGVALEGDLEVVGLGGRVRRGDHGRAQEQGQRHHAPAGRSTEPVSCRSRRSHVCLLPGCHQRISRCTGSRCWS